METADWITEVQRRVDASTAGHWRVWATSVMSGPPDSADHAQHIDVAATFCTDANGRPRTYDAVFIASAHQDLPRALAALRAVLAACDGADLQDGQDGTPAGRAHLTTGEVRDAIAIALG